MNITYKGGISLNLFEYLVLLSPDEIVTDRIMNIKSSFAKSYGCFSIINSKPHITLLKFVQSDLAEKRILSSLEKIIANKSPIIVSLNNFGSFPTHSIYIKINSKEKINDLINSLKPLAKWLYAVKEHRPIFVSEPHLTVARKLSNVQYGKAWLEYCNANFSGAFTVNEVIILRRSYKENVPYQTVGKYPLKNIQLAKQTISQIKLF